MTPGAATPQSNPEPEQAGSRAFPGSVELYAACREAGLPAQAVAYETLWRYLYRVALQILYDQPEAEALAQDCAQAALVRVHERLAECREPAAFLAWARRIAAHAAIDELRRRRRLAPLAEEPEDTPAHFAQSRQPSFEAAVVEQASQAELRRIIDQAPISDRSRRAVLGRYLDDAPDEALAQAESWLAGQPVLPSHVQVTRSKDIARLRNHPPLRAFLASADSQINDR